MTSELLELFFGIVTLNEQMVYGKRAVCQAGIPGQDSSILLERSLDDLIVVGPVVVQDVVPEKAHALCELAQHDIGYKLHNEHQDLPRRRKDAKKVKKTLNSHCNEGAMTGRKSIKHQ